MRHLSLPNPMSRVLVALAGLLTLAVGPGASALHAVFVTGGVYDENSVQFNTIDVEGTLDANPFQVSSGTFTTNVLSAFGTGNGGVIDFDSGSLTNTTTMDASYSSGTKSISITNGIGTFFGTGTFSERTAISGNDFLAIATNPDHDFNFGSITGGAGNEAVTSVGLTLLSRDNANFTGSATAQAFFSNGASTTQSITLTQGNDTNDTFIGFEAPDNASITRVTIDMPGVGVTAAFTGVDDLAFTTGQVNGVVSYTATDTTTPGLFEELTSVTVARGSELHTYGVSELIGVNVTHFKADAANTENFATEFDGTDPAPNRAGLLDGDDALYTGLFNPGGSVASLVIDPVTDNPEVTTNTPGLAFTFDEPVVNGPGPDVVLFELQTEFNPHEGDGFHVSPLDFTGGLNSITIDAFDIQYDSTEAKLLAFHRLFDITGGTPTSLSELEGLGANAGINVTSATVNSKALAVGIDLSDLGYAEGALVSGLFIQDDLADSDRIDLVYLAGLPSNLQAGVPEPSSLLLLGMLTTGVAISRRARHRRRAGLTNV